MDNYLDINRNSWNNIVDVHVASAMYNMDAFLAGTSSLNDIELRLLGDVSGKRILHLQCHFGQDSISLARMGAYVTGVDFSDKAIEKAKELAAELQVSASFVCCDIYSLAEHIHTPFDIVFTSYGTIGWLPDLDKWAKLISKFLKKDGKFVFAEFHPVVWMFDNDFQQVAYPYAKAASIVETETGTYADRKVDIQRQTITWNHGIAEVLTALLQAGLQISAFEEYDYSPYNCFRHTEEFAPSKFRITHLGNKIPMVYALSAVKKAE